jgi:hypothetical protein
MRKGREVPHLKRSQIARVEVGILGRISFIEE